MNNILRFIWKNEYKNFIIWNISLFLTLLLFISLYPSFNDSIEQFQSILDSLPQALVQTVGLNSETMKSIVGFYVFCLTYVLLIYAIYAIYLAVKLFAQETSEKIEDFIYIKPIKRINLYGYKYLAGILILLLSLLIYMSLSTMLLSLFTTKTLGVSELLAVQFSVILFVFVCYNIGVLFAVFFKKFKSISAFSISLVIIMFFLNFISTLIETSNAKFLSPFGALNASLFLEQDYLMTGCIYTLVLSIFLVGLSLFKFVRREL